MFQCISRFVSYLFEGKLLDFNGLPETELERIESIDMNRILEHGGSVKMVLVDGNPISVDTKSDLRKVSNFFSEK